MFFKTAAKAHRPLLFAKDAEREACFVYPSQPFCYTQPAIGLYSVFSRTSALRYLAAYERCLAEVHAVLSYTDAFREFSERRHPPQHPTP